MTLYTTDIHGGGYIHPDFLELLRYDPPNFNLKWCNAFDTKGEEDANSGKYKDNDDFVRNTRVFQYQNIGLATAGIHRPYIAEILNHSAEKYLPSLLDFGAGGGQVGLAFHTLGFKVSFADVYSQSLLFLLWRLKDRKLDLPVYIIDLVTTVIPQHDIVVCFDVIEHCDPEEQLRLLHHLASVGRTVFVNLIKGDGSEIHGLHFAVDVEALTKYAAERWPCGFQDHYQGRQRLLIYGEGVTLEKK